MNGISENPKTRKHAQIAEAHIGTSQGEKRKKQKSREAKLRDKWRSMKYRCYVKTATGYKYYGGKGIKVCMEWRKSFPAFREWAFKNGYRCNLQIDRIDGNGNYSPENCRFVTHKTNMQNRTTTKLSFKLAKEIRSLYATGKYTKTELGKMFGVTRQSATSVIKNEMWV